MIHPYATPAYAASLSHWGTPLMVPAWGTTVIVRDIGQSYRDAAGTYPFAALGNASDIAAGLDFLHRQGMVSVVLVLDAFHCPPLEEMKKHFALLKPFKTHYVHRRDAEPVDYDAHHRRALRRALQHVRVGPLDLKRDWKQWQALYDVLIAKLNLNGLHAFPAGHHSALGDILGMSAIGAWSGDELVSCHVWASDGTFAHSHLVASNDKGYECQAAYAINDYSLKHFADHKIINFGGGAGLGDGEGDGLARFKRGFANATAQSYLCGAILDKQRYAELSAGKVTEFFPAYRAP